jgi:hypothetical protein
LKEELVFTKEVVPPAVEALANEAGLTEVSPETLQHFHDRLDAAGTPETHNFAIRRIVLEDRDGEIRVSPEMRRHLESADELMTRHLAADAKDPLDITINAIAREGYLVYTAESNGKVVAMVTGSIHDLVDADGNVDEGRAMLGMWYKLNDGEGAAAIPQLVHKLEEDAHRIAAEGGKVLSTKVSEVTVNHHTYSTIGYKHVYYTDSTGKKKPIPYFQPPLVCDEEGNPVKEVDGQMVPFEHNESPADLMLGSLDGKPMTKSDLLAVIGAITQYNAYDNIPEGLSPAAEEKFRVAVDQYRLELVEALANAADEITLSETKLH